MNRNFTRSYALFVAIVAVVLVGLEIANFINVMGFSSTGEGFTVTWNQDAPWTFVATIKSWWVWILGILSLLFLLFCREKKDSNSTTE